VSVIYSWIFSGRLSVLLHPSNFTPPFFHSWWYSWPRGLENTHLAIHLYIYFMLATNILLWFRIATNFSTAWVTFCSSWRATHVANVPAEDCIGITEVVVVVVVVMLSPSNSPSLFKCLSLARFFWGSQKFYWFCDSWGGLTLLSTAIFCCFSLGLVSNSIQSSENSLPKCLQWHVLDYRSDVVLAAVSISLSLAISFAVCRQSRYACRACPICLLLRAFH